MKKILINIVRFSLLNYWIIFLFVSFIVATKSFAENAALNNQRDATFKNENLPLKENKEMLTVSTKEKIHQDDKLSLKPSAEENTLNTSQENIRSQTVEPSPTQVSAKDLMTEVSLHNTRNDCWFSYKGHVYNVTQYFGSHPGGDQNLANYCGQNVDVAFDTKGKDQGSPHSAQALSIFQQYLIQ